MLKKCEVSSIHPLKMRTKTGMRNNTWLCWLAIIFLFLYISFDMMFSASLFAVYVHFKCCLMLILYWVICLSLSTCFMMSIHLLVSLTSICIIDLNQQRYSDIISLIRMRLRFELLRTCLIALRGYQARKAENKNTFISEFHLILFKWSKTWLFCGKGCISSQ